MSRKCHRPFTKQKTAMAQWFASHQCDPGSNPGPGIIREFSGFHPSTKMNTSKFQFDLETVEEEPLNGMCHCKFLFTLFILFYFSESKIIDIRTCLLRQVTFHHSLAKTSEPWTGYLRMIC